LYAGVAEIETWLPSVTIDPLAGEDETVPPVPAETVNVNCVDVNFAVYVVFAEYINRLAVSVV